MIEITPKKIIAVVGPTSSGKSELAVRLAKKFNGEIISADSRQVYQGLDVGTGKVKGIWQRIKNKELRIKKTFIYKNIPHHCIDFISPKKVFTVVDFKKCATDAIKDITGRGKIPILCGGTGFYIDAILYDLSFPKVKPDQNLRRLLSQKTAAELFQILKKIDSRRAKTIDRHNSRRLIRAIEIIKVAGKPATNLKKHRTYNTLIVGLKIPKEKLRQKIDARLKKRIKQGLVNEIKKILKNGVTHRRLETLGLEYRFVSLYLRKKLSREEMLRKLKQANRQYAKRQMTWFKRNKDIRWIPTDRNTGENILGLIQKFINSKRKIQNVKPQLKTKN